MTGFLAPILAVLFAAIACLVPMAPAAAESAGTSAIVFVNDRDSPTAEAPVDDVYVMTPSNVGSTA